MNKELREMAKDKKTISATVDTEALKQAQVVLEDMGLPMSTAINMFINEIARRKAMPWVPQAESRITYSVISTNSSTQE